MKLTDFGTLTFDCYGTLIDWESGIYNALAPLIEAAAVDADRDQVLATFAERESAQQAATPDMIYSDLLECVHRQLAEHWTVTLPDSAHTTFGASVSDWPAFADAASSLLYLKKFYKLVILSNVDRASFAASNQKLEVTFDALYTAQDVGSYKPNPDNFTYMLDHLEQDLGVAKSDILHTAQSLFHDHEQVHAFGLATAWIDRRHDKAGWGATMPPGTNPEVDFHFKSMADLVKAHQESLREG